MYDGAVDLKDFVNRVALITGGGSGMGRVAARVFAGRGAGVAVADIDGDGIPEVVLLVRAGTGWSIIGRNLDAESTGQPLQYETTLEVLEPERISAGDLDGDGQAEVVILDDKGGMAMRKDRFEIFSLEAEEDDHRFVRRNLTPRIQH